MGKVSATVTEGGPATSHEVQCQKQDGRWRPWSSYPSLREAQAVARSLIRVGCNARVVTDGATNAACSPATEA